jgi:hypothetical protein
MICIPPPWLVLLLSFMICIPPSWLVLLSFNTLFSLLHYFDYNALKESRTSHEGGMQIMKESSKTSHGGGMQIIMVQN